MQAGLQSVLAIYSYKAASISDVLLVLCNHLAVKASNMVCAAHAAKLKCEAAELVHLLALEVSCRQHALGTLLQGPMAPSQLSGCMVRPSLLYGGNA